MVVLKVAVVEEAVVLQQSVAARTEEVVLMVLRLVEEVAEVEALQTALDWIWKASEGVEEEDLDYLTVAEGEVQMV